MWNGTDFYIIMLFCNEISFFRCVFKAFLRFLSSFCFFYSNPFYLPSASPSLTLSACVVGGQRERSGTPHLSELATALQRRPAVVLWTEISFRRNLSSSLFQRMHASHNLGNSFLICKGAPITEYCIHSLQQHYMRIHSLKIKTVKTTLANVTKETSTRVSNFAADMQQIKSIREYESNVSKRQSSKRFWGGDVFVCSI